MVTHSRASSERLHSMREKSERHCRFGRRAFCRPTRKPTLAEQTEKLLGDRRGGPRRTRISVTFFCWPLPSGRGLLMFGAACCPPVRLGRPVDSISSPAAGSPQSSTRSHTKPAPERYSCPSHHAERRGIVRQSVLPTVQDPTRLMRNLLRHLGLSDSNRCRLAGLLHREGRAAHRDRARRIHFCNEARNTLRDGCNVHRVRSSYEQGALGHAGADAGATAYHPGGWGCRRLDCRCDNGVTSLPSILRCLYTSATVFDVARGRRGQGSNL